MFNWTAIRLSGEASTCSPEPVLICEENGIQMVDLPVLVLEQHGAPRTMSVSHTDHKPAECQSLRLQLCFPFSSSHKGRDMGPATGWTTFYDLASSPCSQRIRESQSAHVPSCRFWTTCATLKWVIVTKIPAEHRTREEPVCFHENHYISGLALASPLH